MRLRVGDHNIPQIPAPGTLTMDVLLQNEGIQGYDPSPLMVALLRLQHLRDELSDVV